MAVAAQQIVVATHNKGKLAEIRAILEDCLKNASAGESLSGESFSLLSAGELGVPDPVETGVTFEENALLKAREACKYTGLPALADDSGLIVDVMGSAPGVLSARWAGVHGDDKANVRLILAQLQDLPVEKLGARFVCSAALVLPDSIAGESWQSKEHTQSGSMRGHLVHEPRGNQGFGYDPIFVPDEQPERALRSGVALTSAELSSEEKNAISHRGKALHAILPTLASVLFNESHLSQS